MTQHVHSNTRSADRCALFPALLCNECYRNESDVFREVCIQQDRRVHLTVVYFGQEGLQEVKSSLDKMSRSVSSLRKWF